MFFNKHLKAGRAPLTPEAHNHLPISNFYYMLSAEGNSTHLYRFQAVSLIKAVPFLNWQLMEWTAQSLRLTENKD